MNQTVQGVPLKELLHLLKPSCFPCLELQSTVWSRSIECLAPPALLFLAEDEPSSPTLTKGGSLCGAALFFRGLLDIITTLKSLTQHSMNKTLMVILFRDRTTLLHAAGKRIQWNLRSPHNGELIKSGLLDIPDDHDKHHMLYGECCLSNHSKIECNDSENGKVLYRSYTTFALWWLPLPIIITPNGRTCKRIKFYDGRCQLCLKVEQKNTVIVDTLMLQCCNS